MFTLMNTAFKYVFGYHREESTKNIDDIITQIGNAGNVSECNEIDVVKKEGCFYTTGYITYVVDDYVLVDDHLICETVNIHLNNANNLKIGDKVYYLALQKDENTETKIKKIISIIDDETWDVAEDEVTKNKRKINNEVEKPIMKRTAIGKVMRREGRKAFIEPLNIYIDLDKINSEFIPMVGDWLKLESLVEVDEDSTDLCGEILEVDRIQPLRSKLNIGIVTTYDPVKGMGTIEKNIIFNKKSCEAGYTPVVGDKVVSDSIESEQGIYTWRSLTVVPLIQIVNKKEHFNELDGSLKSDKLNSLIENKNGIIITSDLQFCINFGDEADLIVLIQNTTNIRRVLQKCVSTCAEAQSQISLAWPSIDHVTILNPFEAISYIFKCRPKFVGTSEELFIFNFQDFQIGRIFRINVNAKGIKNKMNSKMAINNNNNNNSKNKFIFDHDEEWHEGLYIQGIRPCKPPAFIKVRNGIFRIPKHFWDVISQCQNEMNTQIECETIVENSIPCLAQKLVFQVWRDRFHALLYLEEIAQIISMHQFNMESASMRHSGEYLVLEVPGLAEKRPSLLVGDRAIVSFNWDISTGKIKYEGYIHKIRSKEIFLKFNKKFHDDYMNESCQISFKCSPTSMQRCHNALNLAMTHLGADFLFPTRVNEKDPQLILEETENESVNNYNQLIRNDSNSSMGSNIANSIIGSDSSSEILAKSSPRISVAERLFNAKRLVESSTNTPPKTIYCSDKSKHINQRDNSTHKNNSFETMVEKSLDKNVELNSYISQVKKRKLQWFNRNLNHYQKEAVKNILQGLARPLPYVIFGPPGTGKTSTLCETVLQILTTVSDSRLLIATPSNSSANLIAECLLDSGILKPGDLVRIIAHHCLDDNSIPERLLPYCATGNLADQKTLKEIKYPDDRPKINCTMSVLGRHRITVGTCIGLGLLYNMGFPRGHFSHVLVDEAGQATEPEIMIPLNFIHSNSGQVILAGDPLQLGPVVQSKIAQHFGLGESFLARLLHQFPYQKDPDGFKTGYDPRLVTKLIMNYRSLPEILTVPNFLFYDSELQPQVSSENSKEAELLQLLTDELPEREHSPPAIVFHGIIGTNHRDTDSPSWYNPEEATQAYLYLLKFYKHGLTPDDIGIITPYQKQVTQIRDLLMELDVKPPKISSVEGFQGQERKIILLSTVRSSNDFVNDDVKYSLGFVASPKRLNVAITRSRALLIILGNPYLLIQDPYWRHVLKYCIDQKAYTGCNFTFSLST